MRDLEELKEAGYPFEADRGRGGGISLNGRWGIERLNLTNKEAISLLLSLSVTEALTEKSNDLGAKGLKQKIAIAFPENQRKVISELRKRIFFGKLASDAVLRSYNKVNCKIWDDVILAFFESKRLKFEYCNENGIITIREFDPHFLLLNWRVWYLLGWDYLRDEIRIIRIDRIRTISISNQVIIRRSGPKFIQAYESYFTNL